MGGDHPRRLRWTDTGAFRRRIAFVDESRLRWCLDARSGQFKSITPFKSISLANVAGVWTTPACSWWSLRSSGLMIPGSRKAARALPELRRHKPVRRVRRLGVADPRVPEVETENFRAIRGNPPEQLSAVCNREVRISKPFTHSGYSNEMTSCVSASAVMMRPPSPSSSRENWPGVCPGVSSTCIPGTIVSPCLTKVTRPAIAASARWVRGTIPLKSAGSDVATFGVHPEIPLPASDIVGRIGVVQFTRRIANSPQVRSGCVARRGRAVAVTLLVATQRPTQKAMGSGAVRSQMDVRVCLRVRERRDVDLVLGQGMLAAGWHAHTLDAPGKFLISTPEHHIPRARAYLLTDTDVATLATRHAPTRPTLDVSHEIADAAPGPDADGLPVALPRPRRSTGALCPARPR